MSESSKLIEAAQKKALKTNYWS